MSAPGARCAAEATWKYLRLGPHVQTKQICSCIVHWSGRESVAGPHARDGVPGAFIASVGGEVRDGRPVAAA